MRWWHIRGRKADLERELQSDLDLEEEEQRERGVPPEEARHAAMRAFGNTALIRDQTHESWGWARLEQVLRDLRIGARMLRRSPGFTAVAILVTAMGIGATVALFTVVRGVLLRPLPFRSPNRLVRIYEADSHNPAHNHVAASSADFFDWQKEERSFDGMAMATTQAFDVNLSGAAGQLPEQAGAMEASWNLFPILGVPAAIGRLFTSSDDSASAGGTVVLTWGLWERRFGADPEILGKTILVDAKPHVVIGVLPAWFSYPSPNVQLWLPVGFETSTWPGFRTSHGAHNFRVIARLASGATIAQAKADLDAIQSRIRQRYPTGPIFDATSVTPLLEDQVGSIKAALYKLFE